MVALAKKSDQGKTYPEEVHRQDLALLTMLGMTQGITQGINADLRAEEKVKSDRREK